MSQQARQEVIEIDGISVTVTSKDGSDYISLNDLAVRKLTDLPLPLVTGCATVILLSYWEFGRFQTTLTLKSSNSMTLERMLV